LTSLAQNALQSTWVYYTGYRFDWGPGDVGISLAVVGLTAGLVQGVLIGRIVPRLGERRALLLGLGISVLSYTLYGLATQGWMMYTIPFIGALGGISLPSAQSIITQNVQANEQGAVQGALTSLNALTAVVGPLIATQVFAYFISERAPVHLPGAAFFLGAFFILIGLMLAINTFRRLPASTTPAGEVAPVAVLH